MNTSALLLLLFLLSVVFISRMTSALGLKLPWYRDVILLATTPWLAGLVLYLLPLFQFRERLEMRHALYLAGVAGCLMLGAMFARFVQSSPRSPRSTLARPAAPSSAALPLESRGLLWGLALLGFFSQLAIMVNALIASPISLQERVFGDGLQIARLTNVALGFGYDDGAHSRLAVFGAAAFVYVCMVAGGCLARADLKPGARTTLRLLAVCCALLIAFNGVFIRGGRMELVLLVAALVLSALLDGERRVMGLFRRRFAHTRWLVTAGAWVLAIVTVAYLATGFTKSRIGTASAYSAMQAYHRTVPTPWLESVTQGQESLEFAVLNLSYLPVALTTFAYFYDQPEARFPGPYWGQYNFTGPVTFTMRRMGLRDEQQTLQEIRFEATRDLRLHGFGDNVWATAYRDLALDFSWAGVPLVVLLMGGFGQALLLAAGRTRGDVYMALAPLTVLFMLFTLAHSLAVLESFAVGFYMCVAVMAFQAITRLPDSLAPRSMRRPLEGARVAK